MSDSYPLPSNEGERLAEIFGYDFADASPYDSLSALCRLAQKVFDVPIALVTLVGETRQDFLAQCGTDADGTPRKDAFCTYTILADEVLVVNDATKDERFVANPLVTGSMGIRFYAGAPIHLRQGVRLGAFCLLDQVPRSFTDEQASTLSEMAELAANELRHRRTTIELRREQESLAQMAQMGKIGQWALDLNTNTVIMTPEARRIVGLGVEDVPTFEDLWNRVGPFSLPAVEHASLALVTRGEPLDLVLELVTESGAKNVRVVAGVEVAKDGSVTRVAGSLQEL